MKQKIIKFFEELNKAPEGVEVEVSSKNYDVEHVICEAAIIAPLAARKLLEAAELLERARGWLSSELRCTRQLSDEISKFLEDFNDEN